MGPSNRTKLILGGPGCGKTTRLLQIVEEAMDAGVAPESIAFLAFTRKAAEEARDRMRKKFDLDADQIPYFRTLHSFAFMHIPENPSRLLNKKRLMEFAKKSELNLRPQSFDAFGVPLNEILNEDEQAMQAYNLSRVNRIPIRQACEGFRVSPRYVEHVARIYDKHKEETKLIDFTDALVLFLDKFIMAGFEILIVDEAQDLSPIQWAMVEVMMQHARETYIAGDDDQAIYEWAGADVGQFLHLDADREVLPVSYRLRSNIFDACQKVIKYVEDRYPKDWKPHAEGGVIDTLSNLHHVDLAEGEWLVLARTNTLVRILCSHLQKEGYPYLTKTEDGLVSSMKTPRVLSVLAYERLRRGGKATAEECDFIWKFANKSKRAEGKPEFLKGQNYDLQYFTCTGFDASEDWMLTLDMPQSVRYYIRAVRARGESLTNEPRITVSTIHGAKGGEADNVLLWTRLPTQVWQEFVGTKAPQEYRALFTAMSRAKERLVLLTTNSKNYGVEGIIR